MPRIRMTIRVQIIRKLVKRSLAGHNFRLDDVIGLKLHNVFVYYIRTVCTKFGQIRLNFTTDIVLRHFLNLSLEGALLCDDVIIPIVGKD